jgi:ribosomal protein S18 acetylase RimI-like enzyme
MFDLFEITFPKAGRLNLRQYLNFAVRYIYIILINLPLLGRPAGHIMEFLTLAYTQIFPPNYPLSYRWFYYFFGKKLIRICKYHNESAGFALFRIGPVGNIHLCSMGILKKFRGKGLSKPFLTECLEYWQKAGFRSASLYVDKTNHIAIKTYKSLHYQVVKNIDNKQFMFKNL